VSKKGNHNPLIQPFSVLVPPGKYKVHLEAGTDTKIQEVEVLKDPHSEGSLADIEAQTTILKDLQKDMTTVAKIVNEIEIMRVQLGNLKATMTALKKPADLIEATANMDTLLINVESKLIQLKYTGTGQDEVRYPVRLAERINYLGGTIASADFPPADPHREVHQLLKERLAAVQKEYDALKEGELVAFTKMLTENGVGVILK